uniref:Uncharacterized protein n=1 Tax=Anguilla anguilla TaxID=7936 RepID=A0A0E9Q080_ANGAN
MLFAYYKRKIKKIDKRINSDTKSITLNASTRNGY